MDQKFIFFWRSTLTNGVETVLTKLQVFHNYLQRNSIELNMNF